MKKRFLIVALFTLFLGGIAVAQSQEYPQPLPSYKPKKKDWKPSLPKSLKTKKMQKIL